MDCISKTDPRTERIAATGYLRTGQRLTRLSSARHAGFLTEHDLYTDGEIATDPVYRDFLLPAGLGWATSTAITLPTTTLFFTVERLHQRGPVEPAIVQELDSLRPHLARSALISARLRMERARVATDTLALINLPAVVFDTRGTVLSANSLIDGMTAHIAWRAHGTFALTDRRAHFQLSEALQALASDRIQDAKSFVVMGSQNSASLVAHIIPVCRNARDVFSRGAAVLVLTPVTRPQSSA